jgi:hypothetical protein
MRLDDWEQRLGAFMAESRDRPFEWGSHDCLMFALSAAAAITGDDKGEPFRGRYDSRKTATAMLREHGAGTLLKTLDATFTRKKPGFAQRGDLVWFASSVGVCVGAQALFVGEERLAAAAGMLMREGLVTVPRRLWQKAWAV